MLMNFLKKESSFLLALVSFVILYATKDSPLIQNSILVEMILFFLVFAVIIYAALGVVHHAELLAYKFGEPYGTMILTLSAVTVEIIMIATMMTHGDTDPHIARDSIFATLMILLNGLTGLIMLIGGLKYGEQKYNIKSSNSFFSMLFGIIGIGLFLPLVIPPGNYRLFEVFLIVACISLYVFFLRMQSKEQNYYFRFEKVGLKAHSGDEHLPAKDKINTVYNFAMLLGTIVLISVLAESLSKYVDDGISEFNLPPALAGLIIALIIVSPEGLTAIRAGLRDDMQRVINISLGSMLSTVALTIPAVIAVGMYINHDVSLGLTPIQSAMVVISLLVGILSCKDGESNALQGFIHIILFITFVFLVFV
jgi:Ca2+:H+ antiporter